MRRAKINTTLITILILVVVGLGISLFFYIKKNNKLHTELSFETKLKTALVDSIKTYQNKEKELVSEKLSLQSTIKELVNMNEQLNDNQKELLKRVKEIEKNNSVIAAALVQTNAKIDIIREGTVNVDLDQNIVTFSDSTKDLKYNIEIGKVKPINKLVNPTLKFNEFLLPNSQFIEFHWKDNKKEGFPVTFSVSNSNSYFKTANIDSYAIPALTKIDLKPNFWQKNWPFIKQTGIILTAIGISTAIILIGN